MEKNKTELIGAVEYVKIEDGAEIEIPDTMWKNIIRNQDPTWQDNGYLRIEALGDDTYKVTKLDEKQIPMRNIQIPDTIIQQIKTHIDDDAVKREYEYSSIEDYVFTSIDQNLNADRDALCMNKKVTQQ